MRYLSLFLFLFCVLPACQHSSKQAKTAKHYFEQAKKYKKKRNYTEALKALFSVRKNFLESSYNQKALLMTADIHFEQKKYPQALKSYEKYTKIYGSTDRAYILYQMSLAYKNQLPSRPDYDLELVDKALSTIEELLSLNSSYQSSALKLKQELLQKKQKKELKAILFFEKLDWYRAGLKRAKRFLARYPNSPFKAELLLASVRLAEKSEADPTPFRKELLENHPESKETKLLLKPKSFLTKTIEKLL